MGFNCRPLYLRVRSTDLHGNSNYNFYYTVSTCLLCLLQFHCCYRCPEKLADGRIGCLKHPDFSNGVEANIALVKLYKPVKLNGKQFNLCTIVICNYFILDTVKTIRMAEEDDYIGGNVSVVISGFGMDLCKYGNF